MSSTASPPAGGVGRTGSDPALVVRKASPVLTKPVFKDPNAPASSASPSPTAATTSPSASASSPPAAARRATDAVNGKSSTSPSAATATTAATGGAFNGATAMASPPNLSGTAAAGRGRSVSSGTTATTTTTTTTSASGAKPGFSSPKKTSPDGKDAGRRRSGASAAVDRSSPELRSYPQRSPPQGTSGSTTTASGTPSHGVKSNLLVSTTRFVPPIGLSRGISGESEYTDQHFGECHSHADDIGSSGAPSPSTSLSDAEEMGDEGMAAPRHAPLAGPEPTRTETPPLQRAKRGKATSSSKGSSNSSPSKSTGAAPGHVRIAEKHTASSAAKALGPSSLATSSTGQGIGGLGGGSKPPHITTSKSSSASSTMNTSLSSSSPNAAMVPSASAGSSATSPAGGGGGGRRARHASSGAAGMPPLPSGMGSGPASAAASATSAAAAVPLSPAQRDAVEQMESVMDYIESITQALARRTRSMPPPERLVSFRASITPRCVTVSAQESGDGSSDPQHISFLSKLHEASSALLSWFSKLEYTKLAQQVSMEDLERETLGACVSVLSLVESVERKFSTHEEAAVRDAFVKRRKAVYECRELMDMLTKTTQQIVLLRRAVAEQDLFRARELLEDHKSTVKRSARGSSSASSSRYQEEMMKGPFFEWLEQRWFPAMRSWRRIVLDARQRAAAGDVQGAIARSQQEALSIPALQEILRPGETLSDLLQQQIEKPILELGKTFDKKKAVMDGLREAMECPTITELAKAIQAARDFSRVKSGSQQWESADDAVMAEAQQLLLDLQQAESVLRALQLAQQVQSDVCGQFVAVHKANELIHRLHLVENPSTAQRIVRSCRAVVVKLNETGSTAGSSSSQVASAAGSGVKSSCSPRSTPPPGPSSSAHDIARLLELLPSTVSMPDLCLVHMPSKVWTAEHIAAYQDVCKLLVEAYGREQVRRELEKLLDDGTSSARSSQHPPLGSARTPTATTSAVGGPSDVGGTHHVGALDMASANSSRHSSVAGDSLNSPRAHSGKHGGAAIRVDELQRKLQMAEEMGLSGPLVEQAKASLRRLQTLRLKVHFEAQTRLVPIPDAANTSFDTIYNTLYEYCRAQAITSTIVPGQRLRIRYEDHEGDYISIVNEDDWLIMLSDLVEGGALGGARISLYCDFLLLPSAHSMASPPETVAGSPMAGAGQGSAADGDGRGGNATNRNGVGKAGDPLDAEDQLPDDSVSTMPERRKAASPPAAEAGKPTTPTATVKKTQQVAGRSVSPAKNLKSKTSTTGGSTAPSSAPGTTTTIAALLAKANAAKRRSGAAAAAAAGGGTTKGSTPTKPPTPPLAPSSGSTVEANAEQALEDLPPWQRCVIRPATNNAARLRQQVTHRSRSYGARRAAAESPSRRDDVSSVAASSATLQTTTSTAKPGNPSGGTLAPGPASRKFGRLASAPWVSDHRYTDAAAAPSGAMRAVSPGKARVRSRRGSGDRVDGSSPNSSSTSGKHALTLENLIRAQTATHVPTDSTSAGASMRQPTPPPPAAPQNVASNDARGNAGDGLASAGMVGTSSVVHLNMANARRWQDEEGLDLDIQTMVSVSTYLPRSALPPRLPLAPTPPVVTSPNASAGGSATGSTAPRNMFTTTNCCRSGGNGSASGLPKPVERRWNSDDLNLDEIRTVFSDVSGQVDSMKAPRSPVNVGAGRPDGQAVSPDAAIRAARVRPGRQITPQRAPSPLKAVSASGGGGLNDSGAEMAGLPPSPKPPPAVSEAEEKYRCHRSQEEILEEMRKLQRENAKMKDGRRR